MLRRGTISKRHTISIVEYKLSQFIGLIPYLNDKKNFYNNQSEKALTSNKYDKDLYNAIKNNKNYNINLLDFPHKSKFILEFLNINNKINYEGELTEIEEKISNKKKKN